MKSPLLAAVESYDCEDQSEAGYRIIDLDLLKSQVRLDLVCRQCHSTSELVEEKRSGLGSMFRFQCTNKKCSVAKPFFSDQPIKAKEKCGLLNHSMNRRIALAMRYIGCGLTALRIFCGIMNLPPPVAKSSYDKIKTCINEATVAVQGESMGEAAKQEYSFAENLDIDDQENLRAPRDIDVSVDGTYMSRGYSSISKVGVVTAIGCVTGKVLDTSVRSKSCKSCDYWSKRKDSQPEKYKKWLETHPSSCEATHEGSSGSMEALSGVDIFSRPIETHNLRYARYIGDGDTNSFKTVLDSKPYQVKDVVKVECVGHVQKRMGTRLRKLKSCYSGKKGHWGCRKTHRQTVRSNSELFWKRHS